MKKSKFKGRSPSLYSSNRKKAKRIKDTFIFELKGLKPTEKVNLFRWLLSKAWHEGENWTENDTIVLCEVYADLTFIAEKDKNLKVLWFPLEGARGFVSNLRYGFKKAMLHWDRFLLNSGYLMSTRAFYGKLGGTIDQSEGYIRFKYPKKRSFPQAYIGVGYKDKGNAKRKDFDGSPGWQEVALDSWYQYLQQSRVEKGYNYTFSDPPVIFGTPEFTVVRQFGRGRIFQIV